MLIELEFSATNDCNDIIVDILLDGTLVSTVNCKMATQKITLHVDDKDEKDRVLSLSMSGKKPSHTMVDAEHSIVSDITMTLRKIIFDNIDVSNLFCSGQEIYTHDFNGSQALFTDEFYGIIGCNGTINICFRTPIYLWFLEQA